MQTQERIASELYTKYCSEIGAKKSWSWGVLTADTEKNHVEILAWMAVASEVMRMLFKQINKEKGK